MEFLSNKKPTSHHYVYVAFRVVIGDLLQWKILQLKAIEDLNGIEALHLIRSCIFFWGGGGDGSGLPVQATLYKS